MHTLIRTEPLPSAERFLAADVIRQTLVDLAGHPTSRAHRAALRDIDNGGLQYWLDLMELTPGALALVRERIDVAIKGACPGQGQDEDTV